MFEMLYGETPFYAESLVDTYGKIMNHENKFCIPNDEVDCQPVSEEAKALLRNLICNNEQRLGKNGLEDFKLHPFFKDINWDNIRQSESPYTPEVSSPYDTSNFDTEDEMKHKETLPPNKNAAFKGYHLPFIGYTYTENSLLNDCHSLLDFINIEKKIKSSQNIIKDSVTSSQIQTDPQNIETNEQINEYLHTITQLQSEKLNLTTQLNAYQQLQQLQTKEPTIETLTPSSIEITSTTTTTTINPDDETTTETTETEIKLDLEQTINTLNEKILHLTSKLNEMTSLYENSVLDEKQKSKHAERALKVLKCEKDQLFTQIFDLQERVNLQAKDLQEAQTQRKLAVQEFTDVNEKFNELRSKNVKLSNQLLNKEDEIDELKLEADKGSRTLDDLKSQVLKLEAERQEFLLNNTKNESSTDDDDDEPNRTQPNTLQLEAEILGLKSELDQLRAESKEKISRLNDEMQQICADKDLVRSECERLKAEKKSLEEQVNLFNESKQAMSKYDWQMNEILQMVNEEKVVRGHLRSLASKLIEEVDSLRSQTAAAASSSTPNCATINNNNVNANNNNNNGTAWKNRCSEKRERINVQNMQIALEKEFTAKEHLQEEINALKLELDIRAHKICDLQVSIDQLSQEAVRSESDFKQVQRELFDFQSAADSRTKRLANQSYELSHESQPPPHHHSESTPNMPIHRQNSVLTSRVNNSQDHGQDQENLDPSSNVNTPIYENSAKLPNSSTTNSSSVSSSVSAVSSSTSTSTQKKHSQSQQQQQAETEHKFEVVTFNIIERCEFCCGILYGICRQAVKCKDKHCQYLCHPKCRQLLPTNCPININQRQLLKGVNFAQGMGTIMQGNLKVPKQGGVKKGWQDHYVFLSNARLFVFPQVDSKPSLIPSLIVDIKDPQFLVSSVNESDVIHASKRDIPCIFKMIVSKLKSPQAKQKLLFCATNEKDRNNWIMMLKDLNERLIQAAKTSAYSSSIMLPIEAKEICDATTIRNAYSACVYDTERLLIASDEGIDVINIKTDCTIQRFHDKKTFLIDVFREEKLIVAISGKHHQIFLFPTIIVEGMNAEPIKIEETKSCNLFCLGKLINNNNSPNVNNSSSNNSHNNSSQSLSVSSSIYGYSSSRLLCVAIKKVVSIYEINSSSKPKYKKMRDIELTMMVQSMQIINNQLCIGFQSEFALYSLGQENAPMALLQPDRDKSLQFLIKDPINALMAVQISHEEYLLVFENLGVYVNIQGCRSRVEEIMWPSKPLYVAYNDPYLLCFCDRGVDVFHVKTGEWIQIMQFPKTKPLDRSGALCLCNESQDSIRLIHLKAVGDEEVISFLTKNRSLIKSKYRKGSLSRADETHLSLSNSM
jgi:serine/threonine-protein kinase MRCK